MCDLALTFKYAGRMLADRLLMEGIPHRTLELPLRMVQAKGWTGSLANLIGPLTAERHLVKRRITRNLTPGTVEDAECFRTTSRRLRRRWQDVLCS